jgi:hypothetical protein
MRSALEALRRPGLVSGGAVLGDHPFTEAKAGGVRLNSIDLLRGLIMIVRRLITRATFLPPAGLIRVM